MAVPSAFELTGQTAVVTGGGSGIGEATAVVLAEAGARVVVTDIDADRADATVQTITKAGGQACALRVDVARRADHTAAADLARDRFGSVDIWCNIAGISDDTPLSEVGEDRLDQMVAVNVKGVLFGCQAALAAMKPAGRGGAIVNVSSTGIDVPHPTQGVYALTKAAVAMLSMSLAVEAGPHGVRVNATAPGATLTSFSDRHRYDEQGRPDPQRFEAFVERMSALSPLGIVGEPADQAYQILYLVSPAARYVTGNIFRANGGQSMVW